MIKISLKNVTNFFSFETKTTEKIKKEQFQLNIASSVLALSFLVFFMFIDKVPLEYVLTIFSLFTEDWFKIALAMISVFFLLVSHLEKNLSYVLLISIFLLGHFLFVNVFNDKYSIQATTNKTEVKKKRTMHYNLYRNLA